MSEDLMRILIDARSVRTPSGLYVLQGLTRGWLGNSRVDAVIAAIPRALDAALLPSGVEIVRLGASNWAGHLLTDLPRAADAARADVVFCPNGIGPADPRVVVYLQDMFHFAFKAAAGDTAQVALQRAIRVGIRAMSHRYYRVAIAVSPTIAREAEQRFSLPIEIVPNGVDVGGLRWTGGDPVVLVLGGIGARKDEATAVRAWSLVRNRPEDARLAIVGVEPKSRRLKLRLLARELGVARTVSVRGTLPHASYLQRLARCRLAVSCSRLESFGLPVAEALVMGSPLACSAIDAHSDLCRSAGAGALFPARDAEALASIMEAALGGESPPRGERPVRGWDWATRAAQHVDVFERYFFSPPASVIAVPRVSG